MHQDSKYSVNDLTFVKKSQISSESVVTFFVNDVKNLTYVSYYPRTSDMTEFELDRDEL